MIMKRPLQREKLSASKSRLWPTGMAFDVGDQLMLYVSGHYMVLPEFDVMRQYYNYNKGEHIIQVGAEYDSSVLFYAV